ncbi:uncharacterized protein CDAR_219991 [Caerostris darwini]|uniref:Gustatory receptor n=1 Tax=Caerostris darwini TaxID=1538125 RepID=A0AAV4VHU8_9ARAC|nr:uncharacterized protein CDAR_219991 [Caerostris darwini]
MAAFDLADLKIAIAYVLVDILSIVLRHSVLHQKKKIYRLMIILNLHKPQLKSKGRRIYSRVIHFIILIIIILPFLLAALFVYLSIEEDDMVEFYTFGHYIADETSRIFICYIGSYMYYVVYMAYPCFVTLSMCVLVFRCSLYLQQFNSKLKNIQLKAFHVKRFDIIGDYNMMLETVRLLKDSLSSPLFISLISSFLLMYVTLYNILKEDIPTFYMVELICNTISAALILAVLSIFSYRFSHNFSEVSATAGMLLTNLNQSNLLHLCDKRTLFFIKRIEKQRTVHLSACGMLEIKRSFLFTAFGTLFTYGLLIVNLN